MKNRDDRETTLERNALRLRRERECRQNGRKRERESKVERNSRRIVPRASNFRNSIQNRPCHPSFLSSPREGGEYLERGSVNSSLRTIRHPERKQRIPRKRTGKQVPSLFPNRCAVEFQRNIRGERRRKKERKPSLNNKNRRIHVFNYYTRNALISTGLFSQTIKKKRTLPFENFTRIPSLFSARGVGEPSIRGIYIAIGGDSWNFIERGNFFSGKQQVSGNAVLRESGPRLDRRLDRDGIGATSSVIRGAYRETKDRKRGGSRGADENSTKLIPVGAKKEEEEGEGEAVTRLDGASPRSVYNSLVN